MQQQSRAAAATAKRLSVAILRKGPQMVRLSLWWRLDKLDVPTPTSVSTAIYTIRMHDSSRPAATNQQLRSALALVLQQVGLVICVRTQASFS